MYKYLYVWVCVLGWFVLLPEVSHAQNASLFLSPDSGMYPMGQEFSVDVRVNTGGAGIGTADATIVYDENDVTFISVSDEGSIFDTILVDSKRKQGEIDISGFIERGRNPYIGSDGLLARVTFLPKRNVATQLYFSKGAATPPFLTASVGTLINEVLSNLRLQTASYTFIPKEATLGTVQYAFAQEGFEITPIPVPSNEWFSTTSVRLTWTLPEGVTEMKTGVHTTSDAQPSKIYQIPVNSVDLTDLSEGTNYFLLQFSRAGEWGGVTRYPLKVDVSKPSSVVVKEVDREDPSDPHVSFAIEATDTHSGIGWYEMGIDGGESVRWEQNGGNTYQPEGLTPGEHVLTVTAYDKAGNSTSTDTVFLVRSLEPPMLDNASVPERVLTGDTITIRGTSYSNADVTVYISHNDGEPSERKVRTDENGVFVATITEGARAGKYTLWFSVTDERGAMSPNSIKRSIEVSQPYIMLFGSIAVTYLSVIVPLVALILVLGLVLWLGFTWIRGYRRRVKQETNEAYHTTREEFDRLRKELIVQIGMLEKANQSRELTKEEMRIFTDLSKRLDKMEEHIAQEIEDVEVIKSGEKGAVRTHDIKGSLEKYKNKVQVDDTMIDSGHTIRL